MSVASPSPPQSGGEGWGEVAQIKPLTLTLSARYRAGRGKQPWFVNIRFHFPVVSTVQF
jgi:hypothetical protein